MKKNAMLKIAAVVLVAVLLTTCAISTTFAKYVTPTQTKNVESARAAAWGLDISVVAPNVFASNYEAAGELRVDGKAEAKVVAPGTTNADSAVSVSLSGTPEVAYSITATANVELNNWTVSGNTYCPLEFKVGTGNWIKISTDATNTDALEQAVEDAFIKALLGNDASITGDETRTATLTNAPGVAVPTVNNLDIQWRWDFEGSNDNAKDTALGNLAADADTTNDPTVSITFSIGAEQVGAEDMKPVA